MQLLVLFHRDHRWRIHHQILCRLRFGKSNYITNIAAIDHHHHKTIQAVGNTAMRRRSVL